MIRFDEMRPYLTRSRHRFRLLFFSLAFCTLGSGCIDGEEIDRLVAAVNRKVITEGDLDLARSVNELLFYGKNTIPPSRDEEINRLIDLELMRQELKNFSTVPEDQRMVEARMQSLRDAYAEKGGLPAFLKKLGLQESELISYLRLESEILKFVDFRFRPFVSVSEEEIKNYYETKLTPQLRKSKLEAPALVEVSSKIEQILKEEKVNDVLDQWIREIRRNSRIEYYEKQNSEFRSQNSE